MNADTTTRAPLIPARITMTDVTADVLRPIERPGKLWYLGLFVSLAALAFGVWAVAVQQMKGVGVWGLRNPVMWAFDITNFVFWIGIGHAGTLISAILYLLRQRWRTSINRSAEAMTIFAVMTAGLFPLIHLGRTWYAYWLFPYPNERLLWVNFRSPLLWDVFAVSTYFTISLVFWYQGLVPDLATVRDRAKSKIKKLLYGIFSLGWTGSARDWNHYEKAYLLLAALSTPLVLSVHSIVSFDFAVSILPGWHTTIFPPYFVAGAIFSGFAMVMTLLVVLRRVFRLEEYIGMHHLEMMNKIILVTSWMVGYAYMVEAFTAWYSENPFERFTFWNRAFGSMWWCYWIMVVCNFIIPQIFWFGWARRHIATMFIVSIFVNIGMWFERFTIIVTSLYRDFLPASWENYAPTIYEIGMTVGSFGFFMTFFFLFARFLPSLSLAEVKGVLVNPSGKESHKHSEVLHG
ncbi:MAG TPA: NrfD/PsrC family molybdoenzyme membrane anchor subunit [Verrucomicrobiae bacterium]|nr:NrfD/PsrC family molybdoenzyme membrane anchor subunit [Verrucomicrobiae bacterium]